mmetsp:Transcript_24068/g.67148  ORF Transcript_24068/g.67148 Transcript_24068/m.67148 type:complete len:245 (+) Transcript_24068:201-935(+)
MRFANALCFSLLLQTDHDASVSLSERVHGQRTGLLIGRKQGLGDTTKETRLFCRFQLLSRREAVRRLAEIAAQSWRALAVVTGWQDFGLRQWDLARRTRDAETEHVVVVFEDRHGALGIGVAIDERQGHRLDEPDLAFLLGQILGPDLGHGDPFLSAAGALAQTALSCGALGVAAAVAQFLLEGAASALHHQRRTLCGCRIRWHDVGIRHCWCHDDDLRADGHEDWADRLHLDNFVLLLLLGCF